MKALSISGGSTKISFLAGSAIELMKENDYDIITGISAGAIICLLLGIKNYPTLKLSVTDSTDDDLFDLKPTKDNGNISIRALLRVISGKESLGKYAMNKLLRKYYTIEDHIKNQESGKIIKVGAVNLNLVRIEYCDITKVDYDTALNWVVASSSIPIATECVKIGDYYYVDGGVLEHVGGMQAIEDGATTLDVIFSRPDKMELLDKDIDWKPKNILAVMMRTLSVMSSNVTFENESEIKLTCTEKNIPLNIYYTPYVLTTTLYKMEKDLSRSWFELGRQVILSPNIYSEYHNGLEEPGTDN